MNRVILSFTAALWAGTTLAQSPSQVVQEVSKKLISAKTATGQMMVTFPRRKPQVWNFRFLKPNLYEIIAPDQQFRFDGNRESLYLPGNPALGRKKQYQFSERTGSLVADAPFAIGWEPFFLSTAALTGIAATAKIDQREVVSMETSVPNGKDKTLVYFDPKSGLPVGYDQTQENGTVSVRYFGVKLDVPETPASFAWSPPLGAQPIGASALESQLLAPGKAAPTARLQDAMGTTTDLASVYKSHKSTLLYFWNGTSPVPDVSTLKDLRTRLSPQKLEVVVVEFGPGAADSAKTLAAAKVPLAVLIDADGQFARSYGVMAQSEFLVGSDSTIFARFLGYDGDGIIRALRKMGFIL